MPQRGRCYARESQNPRSEVHIISAPQLSTQHGGGEPRGQLGCGWFGAELRGGGGGGVPVLAGSSKLPPTSYCGSCVVPVRPRPPLVLTDRLGSDPSCRSSDFPACAPASVHSAWSRIKQAAGWGSLAWNAANTHPDRSDPVPPPPCRSATTLLRAAAAPHSQKLKAGGGWRQRRGGRTWPYDAKAAKATRQARTNTELAAAPPLVLKPAILRATPRRSSPSPLFFTGGSSIFSQPSKVFFPF